MWLMPFEDIINVRTVSFMIPSIYVFLYISSTSYFWSKRVHFDWCNPSPAGLNFSVEVCTSIPCACLRWHWNLKIQWGEITHLKSAVLYHGADNKLEEKRQESSIPFSRMCFPCHPSERTIFIIQNHSTIWGGSLHMDKLFVVGFLFLSWITLPVQWFVTILRMSRTRGPGSSWLMGGLKFEMTRAAWLIRSSFCLKLPWWIWMAPSCSTFYTWGL